MAEVELHPDSQAFPPGTAVKVFPRVKNSPFPLEGQPLGTELEEATVSAAGVLTVKGVTDEDPYIGWSHRGNTDYYITFLVPPAGSSTGTTVAEVETLISEKAVSTVSPALTGTPTAPTAAKGTNTTQLATAAFAHVAAADAEAAAELASAQRASNLSDLASAATARTNLGLGTAATTAATAYDASGAAATAQAAAEAAAKTLSTDYVLRTIAVPGGQAPGNELLAEWKIKLHGTEKRTIVSARIRTVSGTITVAITGGETGVTEIPAYAALKGASTAEVVESEHALADKDRVTVTSSAGSTPKGLFIDIWEKVEK
jgi:hypothetical protein